MSRTRLSGAFQLLLVVGTAIAAACEAGSTFPPSDMSFEDFCPQWRAESVALDERCNGIPATAAREDLCAVHAASLAAHRRSFDRSRAVPCLKAWRTLSCARFAARTTEICEGLEEPLVGPGGACTSSVECVKNGDHQSFCARGEPGVCPGVCKDRIPIGGDCTGAVNGCVESAACVTTPSGPRCIEGVDRGGACGSTIGLCYAGTTCGSSLPGGPSVCLPTLFPGDRCTGPDAPCVRTSTCGDGGTCARPPVPDEPCGRHGSRYVECWSGWCDGAVDGPPGICRVQVPIGAACQQDRECAGASTLCTAGFCALAVCGA